MALPFSNQQTPGGKSDIQEITPIKLKRKRANMESEVINKCLCCSIDMGEMNPR